MGISVRVGDWLKTQEHDAKHLNDEGLHMLADIDISSKAVAENRVILTADMDFSNLLATHHDLQVSVIQFRVTNFRPEYIILKLRLLLEIYSAELDGNYIITVEDKRMRFRRLPF